MTTKPRPARGLSAAYASARMRSRLIAALDGAEMNGVALEEVLVRQLITRALDGDLGAIRTIFQTIDRQPRKALQDLPAAPEALRATPTR